MQGYGHFSIGGRPHKAHRIAWELVNGRIPAGLVVRHKCDNRPCVAIEHLVLGTHQDNTDDMVSRGRGAAPRGESHGQAQLSSDEVERIRIRAWAGEATLVLARKFGVSQSHIESLAAGTSRLFDGWPLDTGPEVAAVRWAIASKGSRRKARPGAAKVPEETVTLIRERAAEGESFKSIATALRVSPRYVSAVVRGISRRYDGSHDRLGPDRTDHRMKLSDEDADAIRDRFRAGENRKQLAQEYRVSLSYVYQLAQGQKRRGNDG